MLAVSAALGAASELRSLRNEIEVGERLTAAERRDGGARHLGIDPESLARVEAQIPKDARYAIVVAPIEEPPSALTLDGIRQLLRYRLLPRRNVEGPGAWIVTYSGGPAGFAVARP